MDFPKPDPNAPVTSITQLDEYDRLQTEYNGLPGALKTTPHLTRVTPFIGLERTVTWIVQTMRVADIGGDLIFLDRVSGGDSKRFVIPPQVAAVIARQRESLTTKARSRAARERLTPGDASHLQDPEVRQKALATRKAKAAKRRARKGRAR